MSGAMGSHQSARSQSDTWLTPLEITQDLGPFDLDPCAYPGWSTARDALSDLSGQDGLSTQWYGRVWLNPPYTDVWEWLSKLADHGAGTALIFARTETRGFVREVWERATSLRFIHGRLHFHTPDGVRAPRNSGAPSVLVGYGEMDTYHLGRSNIPGTFVRLRGDGCVDRGVVIQYLRGVSDKLAKRGDGSSATLQEAITTLRDRTNFGGRS